MRRMKHLSGVLVPILIPMFDDGSLDLEGTRGLAERFLSFSSVDGLFALGASSEFMHLPFDERKALIETLAGIDRGAKVITAHTGGLPLDQAVELTKLAGRLGIDAAALVIPDEVPPDAAAVSGYFRTIAETGVPFAVYWSPVASSHVPSLRIVQGLMDIPQFVGLKDSARNMVVFTDICTRFGDQISAFQGVEMLHLASLAVGSCGVVGGGLNFYPRLLAEITEAFGAGDWDRARAIQRKVNASWDVLAESRAFRSLGKQYWRSQGVLEGVHCREGANVRLNGDKLKEVEAIIAV